MDTPYIHRFLQHFFGLLSHRQVFDCFTFTCIRLLVLEYLFFSGM
jgi:hypothetical protein